MWPSSPVITVVECNWWEIPLKMIQWPANNTRNFPPDIGECGEWCGGGELYYIPRWWRNAILSLCIKIPCQGYIPTLWPLAILDIIKLAMAPSPGGNWIDNSIYNSNWIDRQSHIWDTILITSPYFWPYFCEDSPNSVMKMLLPKFGSMTW